jgi:glycosyltransferase involved in cell wall biosynthesis
VENYIQADNRFRLIRTLGGNGPYIAANIGIKESIGKYIARTDADDISLPARILTQYQFLNSHETINVCGSLHYYLFEAGHTTFKNYNTDPQFLKWQLIFRNRIVHSTMMFRKIWFEKIGLYPPKRLAQDWHIWLEGVHSNSLHIINQPLVKWRIHNDSITKMENSQQLEEASKVAIFNIENRYKLQLANHDAIKTIIASIRGDFYTSDTDLYTVIRTLFKVYANFSSKNSINNSIKSDLHYTLYAIYGKYPDKNLESFLLYLKTITKAGISLPWVKGFLKHLTRLEI